MRHVQKRKTPPAPPAWIALERGRARKKWHSQFVPEISAVVSALLVQRPKLHSRCLALEGAWGFDPGRQSCGPRHPISCTGFREHPRMGDECAGALKQGIGRCRGPGRRRPAVITPGAGGAAAAGNPHPGVRLVTTGVGVPTEAPSPLWRAAVPCRLLCSSGLKDWPAPVGFTHQE
jgi:hypothetical protein